MSHPDPVGHRIRAAASATVFAVAVALALTLAGCSLFSTRSPTAPNNGVAELPPNFSLPESTLATLTRSVHSRNTSNYGLCLADTAADQREFHATFDIADLTAFSQGGGTPPTDWTRTQELSFFPQFVAYLPNAQYDVFLTTDVERGGLEDIGGPTAKKIYNLHYRVWSGATSVCAGSAGIALERVGSSGEYKVTFWDDRRDTANARTWGAARLNGR